MYIIRDNKNLNFWELLKNPIMLMILRLLNIKRFLIETKLKKNNTNMIKIISKQLKKLRRII